MTARGCKGTCGIIGVLHALDRLGALFINRRDSGRVKSTPNHICFAILTVSPSFWVLCPSPAIPV